MREKHFTLFKWIEFVTVNHILHSIPLRSSHIVQHCCIESQLFQYFYERKLNWTMLCRFGYGRATTATRIPNDCSVPIWVVRHQSYYGFCVLQIRVNDSITMTNAIYFPRFWWKISEQIPNQFFSLKKLRRRESWSVWAIFNLSATIILWNTKHRSGTIW